MKRFLFILLLLPFVGYGQVQSFIEAGTNDTIVITTSQQLKTFKVSTLLTKDSVVKVLYRGSKDTSTTCTVVTTVRKPYKPPTTVNIPPVARAGSDVTITLPTNSTTLNGSGTDADGTIASYQWTKLIGIGSTIASPTTAQTAINSLAAGAYTYRLRVTDNNGAVGNDTVQVTVLPAPTGGQTITLAFTQIPITDPDFMAPGRGAEQWNNGSAGISYPTATLNLKSPDVYYRSRWTQWETDKDVYNWTYFDGLARTAITNGQKLSVGIMSLCAGCDANGAISINGSSSAYPLYLHNLMQAESVKDYVAGGSWIPNWNSPQYLARLTALNQAIKKHANETFITVTTGPHAGKPIRIADIIYCWDIRGFGNWGEWHISGYGHTAWNQQPAGTAPTAATLMSIIDAHTKVFDWPLSAMVAAFGANQLGVFHIYPQVAHYAATTSNSWGPIGWRRDQWFAEDVYLNNLLEGNNIVYNNSLPLKDIIKNKWKTSPVTGEPPGWTTNQYADALRQVNLYHPVSIGNGNYGPTPDATTASRLREAFKITGYRIVLTNGQIVTAPGSLTITLNWQNIGLSPTYENWDVVYELVNSAGVVDWSRPSTFKLKLFPPSTTATAITETFAVAVPAGTYTLRMSIKDPTGYRQFLPLAITGKNTNNSINLKTNLTF